MALALVAITAASRVAVRGAWSLREHASGAPLAAVRAYAIGTFLLALALTVTGIFLLHHRRSATSGWWLVTAGVVWSVNSWGATTSGVGPIVNWCLSTLVWLPIALAISGFPARTAWPPGMKAWLWAAAVDFGPVNLALAMISRPEWDGVAADAWWPTVHPLHGVWVVGTAVVGASYVLIAGWFVVITVRRVRRLAPLDRQVLVPVLRAVATGTGLCAVAALVQNLVLTPAAWAASAFLQILGVLLLPAVVALVAARTLGRRTRIAALVDDLSVSPTADGVAGCLRTLMADPSLDVLTWQPGAPGTGGYVDTGGAPRTPPHPGERLVVPVLTRGGRPLALVCADPAGREHRAHLETAVLLARYVLENAFLEAQLSALLSEQVRRAERSRAAVVDAQRALRRRIAGDLHDGLQQVLLGLAARAGALAEVAPTARLRAEAAEVHVGARQAARLAQDVSRVVYPRLLDASPERGLRDALDVVADRMSIPVDVCVTVALADVRLRAVVYGWTCQVLHAVEHRTAATSAAVTVDGEAGALRVRVTFDTPAAWITTDGALAPLRQRASIVDGTVEAATSPARGTAITARFPLDLAQPVSGSPPASSMSALRGQ